VTTIRQLIARLSKRTGVQNSAEDAGRYEFT
jgi:hypothetical protein